MVSKRYWKDVIDALKKVGADEVEYKGDETIKVWSKFGDNIVRIQRTHSPMAGPDYFKVFRNDDKLESFSYSVDDYYDDMSDARDKVASWIRLNEDKLKEVV